MNNKWMTTVNCEGTAVDYVAIPGFVYACWDRGGSSGAATPCGKYTV